MDHRSAPSHSQANEESPIGALDGLNSKSKGAAPLDRQSLLALIRQQLEFYFDEENLPRDVFLLKQIEKDKTKEGYVSLKVFRIFTLSRIKVIAGFPKMKRLTHDLGAIRYVFLLKILHLQSP
jgi:hypothetical protein